MNLHITKIEAGDDGCWRFFNEEGFRIAQHITAGHMAQMYAEIHNDRLDVREHLENFSGFAATCRRENTYEWMRLMLDWINGVCDRLDPTAFFVLRGASHFDLQRCERNKQEGEQEQ